MAKEQPKENRQHVQIPVTGMTCANCAANIERSIKKLEGIEHVNVNLATERVDVAFDDARVAMNDIIAGIQRAGYGAVIPDEDTPDAESLARDAEVRDQTRKFYVGLLFTLPLFVLSMGRDMHMLGDLGSTSLHGVALLDTGHSGAVLHRLGFLHRRIPQSSK
jgi:P-type Cu+ transporter